MKRWQQLDENEQRRMSPRKDATRNSAAAPHASTVVPRAQRTLDFDGGADDGSKQKLSTASALLPGTNDGKPETEAPSAACSAKLPSTADVQNNGAGAQLDASSVVLQGSSTAKLAPAPDGSSTHAAADADAASQSAAFTTGSHGNENKPSSIAAPEQPVSAVPGDTEPSRSQSSTSDNISKAASDVLSSPSAEARAPVAFAQPVMPMTSTSAAHSFSDGIAADSPGSAAECAADTCIADASMHLQRDVDVHVNNMPEAGVPDQVAQWSLSAAAGDVGVLTAHHEAERAPSPLVVRGYGATNKAHAVRSHVAISQSLHVCIPILAAVPNLHTDAKSVCLLVKRSKQGSDRCNIDCLVGGNQVTCFEFISACCCFAAPASECGAHL